MELLESKCSPSILLFPTLAMHVEQRIIGLPIIGNFLRNSFLIGCPIIPISVIARSPRENRETIKIR